MNKEVSKEDYKYCSRINKNLPRFIADSNNKYGYEIVVDWIDCENYVEDEGGNLQVITLSQRCSCKEYYERKEFARENNTSLYNMNNK